MKNSMSEIDLNFVYGQEFTPRLTDEGVYNELKEFRLRTPNEYHVILQSLGWKYDVEEKVFNELLHFGVLKEVERVYYSLSYCNVPLYEIQKEYKKVRLDYCKIVGIQE